MSFKASEPGLAKIHQAREGKKWRWDTLDNDSCLVEASKYLEPDKGWPIEADGKRLYAGGVSQPTWKRFLQGKAITDNVFKAFCFVLGLNWEDVVDLTSNARLQGREENNRFIQEFWVGRTSLITTLSTKLSKDCRVLVLAGITGIGKTALGHRLAQALHSNGLKCEKPVTFDDDRARDFASVAADLLIRWQELVTADDRQKPERLLDRLLHKLINNRYLVQIDSLEMLLDGDENTGWNNFQDDWWVKFFQRLLAVPECQSRLILTSQHFLTQFQEWGYVDRRHCEPLKGLNESEQLTLFCHRGIEVDSLSSNRPYLERIGKAYEGHPLALQVIAGEILSKPFYGDVVMYWNKYGHEIKEIEKAYQQEKIESEHDRFRLDRYTCNLKKFVKKLIEQTFKRLYEDFPIAYALLCDGSAYRRPVPEIAWFKVLKILGYQEDQLMDAMDALCDRYLVEKVEAEFTEDRELVRQHNLIRSVAQDHLKKLKTRKQPT